jgi:maltose O-acetyltransferase
MPILRKLWRAPFVVLYYAVGARLPRTFWPGGIVFSLVRAALLRAMGCRVGRGCEIEPHVDVGFAPEVVIGNRCQINAGAFLRNVIIGDDALIAPGVVILGRQHRFERTDVPMRAQGEVSYPATILEADVWLGQNVVVMPGVRIGTGAIVGAGAVVTADVRPFDIVGGVPARRIRSRKPDA